MADMRAQLNTGMWPTRAELQSDVAREVATIPLRVHEVIAAQLDGFARRGELGPMLHDAFHNDIPPIVDQVVQTRLQGTHAIIEQQHAQDRSELHQTNQTLQLLQNTTASLPRIEPESLARLEHAVGAVQTQLANFTDQGLPEHLQAALDAFATTLLDAINPSRTNKVLKKLVGDVAMAGEACSMAGSKLDAIRAEALEIEKRDNLALQKSSEDARDMLRVMRSEMLDNQGAQKSAADATHNLVERMHKRSTKSTQCGLDIRDLLTGALRAAWNMRTAHPLLAAFFDELHHESDRSDSDDTEPSSSSGEESSDERRKKPSKDKGSARNTHHRASPRAMPLAQTPEAHSASSAQGLSAAHRLADVNASSFAASQSRLEEAHQHIIHLQDELDKAQTERRDDAREVREGQRRCAALEKEIAELKAHVVVLEAEVAVRHGAQIVSR